MIWVTDNNGDKAVAFKCPQCGVKDGAYGAGRSRPASNGVSALFVHLKQRHGVNLITW